MPVLGEESKYAVQTMNAPQQVDNIMNAVNRGHTLMTPIGGGVTMQPKKALDPQNILPDSEGKVGQAREKIDVKGVAADQWWWD